MLRIQVSKKSLGVLGAIAGWSILLTAIMGFVTGQIAKTYSSNYPWFYDPVGYHMVSLRVFAELQTASPLAVAWHEWLENPRDPLRTTPLVLIAPRLLAEQLGVLGTALPMLAAFLITLGWFVYRRTGHLLYSLAVLALYCAIPGLFNPTLGLAVFWLDLHASFLVGAAAICLLCSSNGRNLAALAAFALFAALAALSRFVAAGYLFFMTAPVLATYLILRWRAERSIWHAVVQPVIVIGAVLGVLAGPFLVLHTGEDITFYTSLTSGWALFNSIGAAAAEMKNALGGYVDSGSMVILLGGILLANAALFATARRVKAGAMVNTSGPNSANSLPPTPSQKVVPVPSWNWGEQWPIGWLAISHILLCVFILRVSDDFRTPLYAWPFIFLAIVTPVPWVAAGVSSRLANILAIAVVALSVVFASRHAQSFYYQAQHPDNHTKQVKQFEVQLAADLAAQGDHIVWEPYYDVVGPIPSLEAYYRFQKFVIAPSKARGGRTLFNNIRQQDYIWNKQYPGQSPEQVSLAIYNEISQWVDIVVVFDDPTKAQGRFITRYAEAIAQTMAEKVRTSPQWTEVFTVDSPDYGRLAGYRNLAAEPGAFTWLISHYGQELP